MKHIENPPKIIKDEYGTWKLKTINASSLEYEIARVSKRIIRKEPFNGALPHPDYELGN